MVEESGGGPGAPDPAGRPVAVVGAGTLGRRIALMLATGGGEVRLSDPDAEQRGAAVRWVEQELPDVLAAVEGGSAGRVTAVGDLAAAAQGAWLVVEAVPERLDLKRSVFAELDRVAPPDAVAGGQLPRRPGLHRRHLVLHPPIVARATA